ncbi:hypothetical protein MUP77_09375 [Candidatus Bathyarchaeota archaeon]|nr:hypothetical protein [Candidatus Bathyarchaeota archaeon]
MSKRALEKRVEELESTHSPVKKVLIIRGWDLTPQEHEVGDTIIRLIDVDSNGLPIEGATRKDNSLARPGARSLNEYESRQETQESREEREAQEEREERGSEATERTKEESNNGENEQNSETVTVVEENVGSKS